MTDLHNEDALAELHSEAVREDWARRTVAAAGKSWATHLAKFDGTVLPRDDHDDDEEDEESTTS